MYWVGIWIIFRSSSKVGLPRSHHNRSISQYTHRRTSLHVCMGCRTLDSAAGPSCRRLRRRWPSWPTCRRPLSWRGTAAGAHRAACCPVPDSLTAHGARTRSQTVTHGAQARSQTVTHGAQTRSQTVTHGAQARSQTVTHGAQARSQTVTQGPRHGHKR